MTRFILGMILLAVGMYGLYAGFNAYLNGGLFFISLLLIIVSIREKVTSRKVNIEDTSVTTSALMPTSFGPTGSDSGCSNGGSVDVSE